MPDNYNIIDGINGYHKLLVSTINSTLNHNFKFHIPLSRRNEQQRIFTRQLISNVENKDMIAVRKQLELGEYRLFALEDIKHLINTLISIGVFSQSPVVPNENRQSKYKKINNMTVTK